MVMKSNKVESILGFHVMSRDHKISLNSRYHFFWLQKWIELSYFSWVANFWLSSHNFGKVAVIQKFQYFQSYNRVLYGAAMIDNMACHPTGHPI